MIGEHLGAVGTPRRERAASFLQTIRPPLPATMVRNLHAQTKTGSVLLFAWCQQAFDKAILDASSPFRRDDGSYQLDNIFRFAVARAR